MVTYKYKALSRSGVEVTGVIKAHDRDDAVIKLKEEHRLILEMKEVMDLEFLRTKTEKFKIKEKNLALMCQQFAILLKAGLPIAKTVELVGLRTEDRSLKRMLESIAEDVNAGYGLADSFGLRGEKLPTTFIETMRAGEEAGSLEIAFERLSGFFEKKSVISEKVRSALTYPIFVIIVAIIVIGIIMIYAVPVFTRTFEVMGIELPLLTRMVIAMSGFFKVSAIPMIILAVILTVSYRIYHNTAGGAIKIDKKKLSLPIVGRISIMNTASQFANTFSTMLAAGIPAVRALSVTAKSLTNAYITAEVLRCVEQVEQGYSIGASLKDVSELPELLIEMTAVGEESGSMEGTLRVIGDYYDQEVEFVTGRAVKLLEPAIICVLAVFVVFVLLSVYLPMFSMYGAIG